MKLKLFDFIDEAMRIYDLRKPSYTFAQDALKNAYEKILEDYGPNMVGIHTRIKTAESVREKLLRNKFYQNCSDPKEAIDTMHDIVGITIECRFIRNEHELYDYIRKQFSTSKQDHGFYPAKEFSEIYLNLDMAQPQIQRNGYTIFRLDGCYHFNGRIVNYELQIKALVHRFWSEIEHEVIYKNQEMVSNDAFLKSMLGSLADSLDVVDRQMEIIYNQICEDSSSMAVGLDEKQFKLLSAQSINALVKRKMLDSVGYSTDFRKDASILAQYIYIRFFLHDGSNEARMVEYLEHLNDLSHQPLPFDEELVLERPYQSDDILCSRLEHYWEGKFNADFEWHAFFTTLFAIQEGECIENITDFTKVISELLVLPSWYESLFQQYSEESRKQIRNRLKAAIAQGLIEADTIETIHENYLYQSMQVFRNACTNVESYGNEKAVMNDLDQISAMLTRRIVHLFH